MAHTSLRKAGKLRDSHQTMVVAWQVGKVSREGARSADGGVMVIDGQRRGRRRDG